MMCVLCELYDSFAQSCCVTLGMKNSLLVELKKKMEENSLVILYSYQVGLRIFELVSVSAYRGNSYLLVFFFNTFSDEDELYL